MEKLMKEMKSLDDQREAEIQNLKDKCNSQETMISSMKKCLQMDELEKNFEKHKKDTAARIKILEDSKLQLENEKSALKKKYNASAKSLTTETSLRLSSAAAQRELQGKVNELQKQLEAEKALRKTDEEKAQKKINDLSKELEAEKTLRKTVEDKVFSLESQIALNKVIPMKDQINGSTPVTPVQSSSIKDIKPTSGFKVQLYEMKQLKPVLLESPSYSTRATKKRKSMGTVE